MEDRFRKLAEIIGEDEAKAVLAMAAEESKALEALGLEFKSKDTEVSSPDGSSEAEEKESKEEASAERSEEEVSKAKPEEEEEEEEEEAKQLWTAWLKGLQSLVAKLPDGDLKTAFEDHLKKVPGYGYTYGYGYGYPKPKDGEEEEEEEEACKETESKSTSGIESVTLTEESLKVLATAIGKELGIAEALKSISSAMEKVGGEVSDLKKRIDNLEKTDEVKIKEKVQELPTFTIRRMSRAAERVDKEAKTKETEKATKVETFEETSEERQERLGGFWEDWQPPGVPSPPLE